MKIPYIIPSIHGLSATMAIVGQKASCEHIKECCFFRCLATRCCNCSNMSMCSIPDDLIDKRRFPLFFARDVLQALVAELKAENAVAP